MRRSTLRAWTMRSLAALVLLVAVQAEALAGGAFLIRSAADRRIVDITGEVMNACTRTTEKRLAGGLILEVRHAPGSESLARAAIPMLESVHAWLTDPLGFDVRTGVRLYIVELERYPPSFRIVDSGPRVPGFAVLNRRWPEEEKLAAVGAAVYDTLPHEWAHQVLSDRFGRRSPGGRARWIDEGFASYVQYTAARALWPEGFDRLRARHLPLLNLHRIDLEVLLRWGFAHSVPPREPADEFLAKYGAALGVFLRVDERGGPRAVLSFLDKVAGRGRLRDAEVHAALRDVTGRDLVALAKISAEEARILYEEGLTALASDRLEKQSFGLAVVERFPERFESHREPLAAMVADSRIGEAIRARAARLAADQGPKGTAASLLSRVRGCADRPLPEQVELPLVVRLATDDPTCGAARLARLASSTDSGVASRALDKIREISGRKVRPEDAARWAESRPSGSCDREP